MNTSTLYVYYEIYTEANFNPANCTKLYIYIYTHSTTQSCVCIYIIMFTVYGIYFLHITFSNTCTYNFIITLLVVRL